MNFRLYVGYQTNSNYFFMKAIPFNPNDFIYFGKQSSSWMQLKIYWSSSTANKKLTSFINKEKEGDQSLKKMSAIKV